MLLNYTGTQTIETQRLILRRFEITDTQSVFENWISDPKVQYNYGEPAYNSIAEAQRIIEKWVSSYNNNEFYRWTIIHKEKGESIGQIAFYLVDSRNLRNLVNSGSETDGYTKSRPKPALFIFLNH